MEINPREIQQENISKEVKDFILDLKGKIEKDIDARKTFEAKCVIATNQRLGTKRESTGVSKGYYTIPIPETDKQIRKKKPSYVLSVIGQNKPADVTFGNTVLNPSEDMKQSLKLSEAAFNKVIKEYSDMLKVLTVAADQFLEKGHAIFKVIEEFKCEPVAKVIDLDNDYDEQTIEQFDMLDDKEKEVIIADRYGLVLEDDTDKEAVNDILSQYKSGEKVIRYTQMVYSSMPKIVVPESQDIITPYYTKDIEESERITHRYFLTERELKTRAINGSFDKKVVDNIIEYFCEKGEDSQTDVDTAKNNIEGIGANTSGELFEIHEVSCWRPTGKDGRYERWVVTYLSEESIEDSILQIIKFPYEFDKWNYVKHDFELKDNRYLSSRGIPEMIRGMHEVIEKSVNNLLIRDEINNTPVFTVLKRSANAQYNLQFVPGIKIPVTSHDELNQLAGANNKVDMSSSMIIQTIKAFAEEYLGSVDQLFRNATNAGGGKTLGEINTGIAIQQNLAELDLLLWNETLKKVYRKMWIILKNRLGSPIMVDGVPVTREYFNFDVEINPTGQVENLNKNYVLQKAQMRVQMIIQMLQLGQICNADDLYNAVNDFLEIDGVKNPDRYITDPKQMAQEQITQLNQQIQQMNQYGQQLMAQNQQAEQALQKTKIKVQKEGIKKEEREKENANV